MADNLVPYEIIVAASSGDETALQIILRHFGKRIEFCALRTFYDEYGNRYEYVDEDIRQAIETRLVTQIITKFDPAKLPEGEVLEP